MLQRRHAPFSLMLSHCTAVMLLPPFLPALESLTCSVHLTCAHTGMLSQQ